LRLLHCLLLLGLLQLSHLHGRLSIKPGLLEALLRGLQPELSLLTSELACHGCLLSGELGGVLAKAGLLGGGTDGSLTSGLGEASGLQSKACLLGSSTDGLLTGLLREPCCLHAQSCLLGSGLRLQLCGLRQLLRGALAKACLLRGNRCLQPGLRAKGLSTLLLQCGLLRGGCGLCCTGLTQLLGRLLAKPGLLSRDGRLLGAQLADTLCSLSLALLLLLERCHGLRLRLAVALRHQIGNRVGLLLQEAALKLGTLHAFALSTERARPHSLG
jgi:hypothetical protein